MSRVVTIADLADFCRQCPDQSAQAMLLGEDGKYRPVAELVPMQEGRVLVAAPGDYDRVVQLQQQRRERAQPEQPTLRLTGGDTPESP